MALPRSFSVNSSSLRDDDRDYRELVRAASQRVRTTQIRITKLSDHHPFNRSLSTYTENRNRQQNSVGRINEESPCYFSGSFKKPVDEDLRFPRSRSCCSVENLNLEKKIKIIMVTNVHWVPAAFTVTATVLGISIWTWVWIYRRRDNHIITAGPKSWPLLGSTLELIANLHRLYDWLTDYAMHFPTFEAKYIGFKLLFTVDPANVEYILKTNFSNYVKGPAAHEIQYDLLSDGIFNTDGEMWKLQRKSASLEFSSKMLRDYSADAFRKYALKLAMILQGQLAHNNNVANMQDMFMRMTFDSICEVGFGVEIGSLASSLPDVPFASAFDRSNALCTSRYFDPFWKLKKRFNLGSEAKLKQDVRVLDDFTYGIIQKRRNLLNAHQDEEIGAPRQLDAVINLMQSILSESIDAVYFITVY